MAPGMHIRGAITAKIDRSLPQVGRFVPYSELNFQEAP